MNMTRFLAVLLLLATLRIPITAQNNAQVFCHSTPDLETTQIPDEFPGILYEWAHNEPSEQSQLVFQQITATGIQDVVAPIPITTVSQYVTPTLSPDGHLLVFSPWSQPQLAVWDTLTQEVAYLLMTDEEFTYLGRDLYPSELYRRKLIWISSDTVRIQYFDLDDPQKIDRILDLTITRFPLTIHRGEEMFVSYPDVPLPPPNPFRAAIQLSPQGTYTAVIQGLVPSRIGGVHLSVYRSSTLEQLLNESPWIDEDGYVLASHPFWSPDDAYSLVLVLKKGSNGYTRTAYVDMHDQNGELAIETGFDERLTALLGGETTDSLIFPTWNTYGDVAFRVGSSSQRYIIIYTPSSGQITAICDHFEPSRRLDGIQPFWSPDGRYFGYRDVPDGRTFAFDKLTGDVFQIAQNWHNPFASFIGWRDLLQDVLTFSLHDGETSTLISELSNAGIVEPDDSNLLTIRAATDPLQVGSILFNLNGMIQTDSTLPYEFTEWTPAPGQYTLTATPYSSADGQGIAGTPLTIYFTVQAP